MYICIAFQERMQASMQCENSSVGRAQPCPKIWTSIPTLARSDDKAILSEVKYFNAKIAQLVEHNLAKVGVAGSSPVFRSKGCRSGGIGRHAGLKIP